MKTRLVMVQTTQFRIGADAIGRDGVCGEVSRVVVDPIARAVTHLVVEPKHRRGLGRLVPLELVEATPGEIRLRCTHAAFEKLEPAEETHFLPGNSADADYGPGHALVWPYFGMGLGGVADPGMANVSQPVAYDRVPLGEVAVHRGEKVHATDGDIGRVEGLVVDAHDHQVTHVLLQEGHLWGRKEVAIPIGAVIAVDDGIRLNITKQEVQDLAPVGVDHRAG
jgi:sporulation protein YlmC with PRC-barrel domain